MTATTVPAAGISISGDFDSGSMASASVSGDVVTLRPRTYPFNGATTSWWNSFRIDGAAGRTLTFVYDTTGLNLHGHESATRYVISYDQQTWAFPESTSGSGGGAPEDARYIAAQYDSGNSQRSWGFQVNASNGLTLLLGDMATFWESPDTADGILDLNKDYYVAATFDIATDDAIFYWQDLTGGGTLQSQTVSLAVNATSLGDPTLDFTIGYSAGSDKRWDAGGFIDSVRLSNTALAESELLISVPEPSTIALMFGAAAGLFVMVRRRRS